MKKVFGLVLLAALFVAPGRCFALWSIAPVSTEQARRLGLEVRAWGDMPNHPNQVRVELEFKTVGEFEAFSPKGQDKDRSSVDLQFGEGYNPTLTVPLPEDRSQPGRVIVRFHADRAHLDKIKLRVMAPNLDGGTVYQLRVKDFVEAKKVR